MSISTVVSLQINVSCLTFSPVKSILSSIIAWVKADVRVALNTPDMAIPRVIQRTAMSRASKDRGVLSPYL